MSDRSAEYLWGEGDDREPRYTMGRSSPESDGDDVALLGEESAPDCVGKLLGVRCFLPRHPCTPSEHGDDRLYSLFYDHIWTPGKDEQAKCLYHTAPQFAGRKAPREHASPHGDCKCGLYAYYSYWYAWREAPRHHLFRIFAVVGGWGDIEEHKNGFRSEYMRIEVLIGPSISTIRRRKVRKTLERFAEIYEVPVVWSPWEVHRWMDDFAGGARLKKQK